MEQETRATETGSHKHRRHWPSLKILATLILVVAIFAAGDAVGRGDIHVWRLSSTQKVASSSLDYSSVDQVYSLLQAKFDGNLNQTALINGAKQGLVAAAGDPYTEFFKPSDAQAFNQALAGSITGIGAEIGADTNNNIEIVSPIAGYPAAKAGLQPKDMITAVNGQSTAGMSVDAVVSKIRGDAGTKVTLTIVRNNGNPFDVTMTREKITIPSVTWSETGNIGYMQISQFTDDTTKLAQQAANEFKTKGVKAVILDLRGNPGGYLSSAVDVSSLWLDQGKTVVSERRGSTVVSTEYSTGNNPLKGLPTTVLINGGSASASEITAGALHDNGAATLVGVQSFGKGSVQDLERLPDGSELKITVAHWYTPDGININKKGITPDVVVDNPTSAQTAAGQDPQKDKATEILQSKM